LTFDQVDIISFNDQQGNNFSVRDRKDIEKFETIQTIETAEGMDLDEVISRIENFGDGSEDLSAQVVDHNIVKLAESNFDLAKIKKLNLPTIENE
jgi:hypothetical protein